MSKLLATLVLLVSLSVPGFGLTQANAVTQHKDGSVTLSPQEVAQLQDQVNFLLQEAYKAGINDGVEAAKDNPKICPKDV